MKYLCIVLPFFVFEACQSAQSTIDNPPLNRTPSNAGLAPSNVEKKGPEQYDDPPELYATNPVGSDLLAKLLGECNAEVLRAGIIQPDSSEYVGECFDLPESKNKFYRAIEGEVAKNAAIFRGEISDAFYSDRRELGHFDLEFFERMRTYGARFRKYFSTERHMRPPYTSLLERVILRSPKDHALIQFFLSQGVELERDLKSSELPDQVPENVFAAILRMPNICTEGRCVPTRRKTIDADEVRGVLDLRPVSPNLMNSQATADAIERAMTEGRFEIIQEFIQRGFKVEELSRFGKPPLLQIQVYITYYSDKTDLYSIFDMFSYYPIVWQAIDTPFRMHALALLEFLADRKYVLSESERSRALRVLSLYLDPDHPGWGMEPAPALDPLVRVRVENLLVKIRSQSP